MTARWYDPTTATFTSRDDITLPDTPPPQPPTATPTPEARHSTSPTHSATPAMAPPAESAQA